MQGFLRSRQIGWNRRRFSSTRSVAAGQWPGLLERRTPRYSGRDGGGEGWRGDADRVGCFWLARGLIGCLGAFALQLLLATLLATFDRAATSIAFMLFLTIGFGLAMVLVFTVRERRGLIVAAGVVALLYVAVAIVWFMTR